LLRTSEQNSESSILYFFSADRPDHSGYQAVDNGDTRSPNSDTGSATSQQFEIQQINVFSPTPSELPLPYEEPSVHEASDNL